MYKHNGGMPTFSVVECLSSMDEALALILRGRRGEKSPEGGWKARQTQKFLNPVLRILDYNLKELFKSF